MSHQSSYENFSYYLKYQLSEGITKLFGKNASFEEKHCGIHFGLGGKADNTFHLDMMMRHSIFKFDDQLAYDGAYRL